MFTATRSSVLLVSALALAAGCDEAFDDPAFAEDGAVAERCVGSGCTVGGIGNTSKIGDHALSNMAIAIGTGAANSTSSIKITGGIGYWGVSPMPIDQIYVAPDGELRLRLSTAGWIMGTAVKNAYFNLTVTPNNGDAPFVGKLLIEDVNCEPGQYDPTMTICRYDFVTNVLPDDPGQYSQSTKHMGWYHTCPMDDEAGTLPLAAKYSAVLSPQVTLFQANGATPRIDVANGYFINGCLNGAVSKGQWRLNAFYDATAYRGLKASQRSAMLLMWMAWFNGASRTQPGMIISPNDNIAGLFTWTATPNWEVEAGYGSTGAVCRGGSLNYGIHRYIPDPVVTLLGWAALPHCDPSNIASKAPLGVKVENDSI